MNIPALAEVIAVNHPTTGNEFDVDDEIAAAQMNELNCFNDRNTVASHEIADAVQSGGEYAALSDSKKVDLWRVLHMVTVNPFGLAATILLSVFNAVDSPTIEALKSLRKTTVSCANLNANRLGLVRPGDITQARSIT